MSAILRFTVALCLIGLCCLVARYAGLHETAQRQHVLATDVRRRSRFQCEWSLCFARHSIVRGSTGAALIATPAFLALRLFTGFGLRSCSERVSHPAHVLDFGAC